MFKKKQKDTGQKKTKPAKKKRTMYVGTYRKPVIALWALLLFSVSFGIYKNFTAIDRHTIHEKEIVQLRLNDTSGIIDFVKRFTNVYYTWENNKESIEARKTSLAGYLTKELQMINEEMVRLDIPTSAKLLDVRIWNIKQLDEKEYEVSYQVTQEIREAGEVKKEGKKEKRSADKVTEETMDYMIRVHVEGEKDMVIIQNPTLCDHPEKSGYEPEKLQSDTSIPTAQQKEITVFLETFFKLYPKATETELAYYAKKDTLPLIDKEYRFSKLVEPVFLKENDGVRVRLFVHYIDERTKAMQISQYDFVLQKDTNWKIVAVK